MTKTKRKLKGIHFNFDKGHIAQTDWSQGGAASGLNEPFLLKSLDSGKELTKDQKDLLLEIGMTESEIGKSLISGKPSLSSLEENEGDEINADKGKEMSEEILKQLEDLKRENAVIKAEKQVSPYSFGELEAGVASAMADLDKDGAEAISKAFAFLAECGEAGVAEAIEKAKAEKPSEESALQKALDEEAGVEGKADGEPLGKAEQKQADLKKSLDAEYEKLDKRGAK